MILITRGAANTIILSLAEKITLSSPKYLFRFVNELSHSENSCIASDTSGYTYRYNQFTITESTTESRTTGTLNLSPPGQWRYYIYEQSSSSNLDYINASSLLETGMVRVIGETQGYNIYNGQTQSWTIYDRGTV